MDDQIYRLKMTLRESRPPVWRRLDVPADVTLSKLHVIFQIAMGWTNSHLHQFERGGTCYGEPDPEFGTQRKNERRIRLGQVLRQPKDRMWYEYDFGDFWEHDILLEKILLREPGIRYPRVLKGKGACPPEDVGGIGGYYRFLDAIANPQHPEHAETLKWHGGGFDPNAFDVEVVNETLHPRTRRRRRDEAT